MKWQHRVSSANLYTQLRDEVATSMAYLPPPKANNRILVHES